MMTDTHVVLQKMVRYKLHYSTFHTITINIRVQQCRRPPTRVTQIYAVLRIACNQHYNTTPTTPTFTRPYILNMHTHIRHIIEPQILGHAVQ